ncbi:hypothetical protein [Mucilaginibacter pedocola]|uniref:DoxX family protein n=1 Tax=Mucilaginibacter pedocola TaxID=1792845 RepID=A0A1S9PNT4_9SPHI|nr:hypothetical protein [Mucilaginibacter pedocola]OOQ62228.1 hypothetical protein BC343_04075 [Mucilaginibacter pedocola]
MNTSKTVHYILRIAVAMCFIGHGAFGIITKEVWCNYFAVFGIGKATAYTLMPWVGAFDILMGVVMLFLPVRAIALWLVVWGVFTALLRPLSGEPVAEVIERAGNFGAPLALLLLSGKVKNWKQFFVPIDPSVQVSQKTMETVSHCLQMVVFLLLIGHGWLNVIEKKGLLNQYASLGFSQPGKTAIMVGVFEITAAFIVLIKPIRAILLVFFAWKIATELFYPKWELFEWIERGGSYGAILALWAALKQVPSTFSITSLFKTNKNALN